LMTRKSEPPALFQELPKFAAPVLLVEGELSPRLFKLAVTGLKTALPNAEHVLMRGVAHGLHLEAPRFFTDVLQRFLAKK
jgi:non-heme chloroperoxidase